MLALSGVIFCVVILYRKGIISYVVAILPAVLALFGWEADRHRMIMRIVFGTEEIVGRYGVINPDNYMDVRSYLPLIFFVVSEFLLLFAVSFLYRRLIPLRAFWIQRREKSI